MKKLLLIVVALLVLTLSGCSNQKVNQLVSQMQLSDMDEEYYTKQEIILMLDEEEVKVTNGIIDKVYTEEEVDRIVSDLIERIDELELQLQEMEESK